MTEFSVVRFEARDGVQLAVHVGGSGPAVVCIPGGPGRASEYLEDFGGLSASHTLLRLDLRGTGRSELPEERESLQFPRLADDIEDLRVARGLDSIDIIAHSAGCFVSLVYAMRYPTRLSRLVLVTPSSSAETGTPGSRATAQPPRRPGACFWACPGGVQLAAAWRR